MLHEDESCGINQRIQSGFRRLRRHFHFYWLLSLPSVSDLLFFSFFFFFFFVFFVFFVVFFATNHSRVHCVVCDTIYSYCVVYMDGCT